MTTIPLTADLTSITADQTSLEILSTQSDSATGLELYLGELHTVILATDTDLSATTLEIVFDNLRGTQVVKITDGSITKTATTLSFTATSTLTQTARMLRYAVRNATTKKVYIWGIATVDDQPLADA